MCYVDISTTLFLQMCLWTKHNLSKHSCTQNIQIQEVRTIQGPKIDARTKSAVQVRAFSFVWHRRSVAAYRVVCGSGVAWATYGLLVVVGAGLARVGVGLVGGVHLRRVHAVLRVLRAARAARAAARPRRRAAAAAAASRRLHRTTMLRCESPNN